MKQPSQEDLLGYVLGALDAQEERDLEKTIDAHPEIEEQLLELQHSMQPLESLAGGSGTPRPGLARRTCELIANIEREPQSIPAELIACEGVESRIEFHQLDENVEPLKTLSANGFSFSQLTDRLAPARSWARVDFFAALAMLVLVACLLMPAIAHSRFQSRVAACQQNLREVGTAMLVYSDLNNGHFLNPTDADLNSNAAGLVAPALKSSGLIDDDSLFTCAGRAEVNPTTIPTLQQIRSATGEQLSLLKKRMGGDFGYTLGFFDDGQYHAPKNDGSSHTVLIADMPSTALPGRSSTNHGGKGQNCLFADGRVDFISTHAIGDDAIYENDLGIVGPGISNKDNVIAPSRVPVMRVEYELLSD